MLQESIEWLNTWERNKINGLITADEFLTKETAQGSRVTIQSTLDICSYLINRYKFKYLLTGRLNQDNLEAIKNNFFFFM